MNSVLWPILRKAMAHPMRVVIKDDQREWRYIDLIGGAYFLARRIRAATDNRHIGIMLPTSGMSPMAFIATWMLGRTVVPINYLLGETERNYIIEDSGIDTLVTVGPMLEALEYEPKGVELIKLDDEVFKGLPPIRMPAIAGADDLAAILYTSGTSGKPKGVMLTHRNLSSNVKAAAKHVKLRSWEGFLGVLPHFHSFGLTALMLLPLSAGSRVTYTARFVPNKIVGLIRENKPEIIIAIPSMYGALLSVKKATADDFKSVVHAVSGGEPLSQAVFDEFQKRFNVRLVEGYGLTETSPVVSWATRVQWKNHSVGKLLPGIEVRIVDEQGVDVARGEEGEILIRGLNVMKGYYKMPELTAEVIDDRGYFKSGDWGKLDEDGFLFITGRLKEMLIIGGENVFPREIEEVLGGHESVKAAAVVGRQDPSRGEVAVAFVEVADGEKFDQSVLRAYCREHLATFKVPREIRAIDELPRNPTGKILRRELIDIANKESATW